MCEPGKSSVRVLLAGPDGVRATLSGDANGQHAHPGAAWPPTDSIENERRSGRVLEEDVANRVARSELAWDPHPLARSREQRPRRTPGRILLRPGARRHEHGQRDQAP